MPAVALLEVPEDSRLGSGGPALRQWRCWSCGRVLAHYQPPVSVVRVICQRCNACNVLTTEEAA